MRLAFAKERVEKSLRVDVDGPFSRQDGAPFLHSDAHEDSHLRSARDARGYYVQGRDGAIGYLADFLVDDETWQVRYLVVDTSSWWFGKRVLVAPGWASRVGWAERQIHLSLFREQIGKSPDWDGVAAVNPEYEARLRAHYGRAG